MINFRLRRARYLVPTIATGLALALAGCAGEAAEPSEEPADDGAEAEDHGGSQSAADSVLAPECPVVPGPPVEHTVISADVVEVEGGFECTTVIDSRGDSLDVTRQIEAQLDAVGYEQTSSPVGDDSAEAVNVMSYLIGGDELHITVRQDGVSGLVTHYALISPARGNG